MMDHCIRACPEEHWEGRIANASFRWVAYHTLFWLDLYLSPATRTRSCCAIFTIAAATSD